jgi:hypothetical protein
VSGARTVPPRFGSARSDRPTLGPVLADLARQMGVGLFPWQRLVGDVSLELVARKGRRGQGSRLRLAASSVGVMASRQTGKTSWAAARVALQCMLPDLPGAARAVGIDAVRSQKVGFTAQDRIGALGRWYEHVDMIMSSPLRDFVRPGNQGVKRKNGEECLYFENGSEYRVITPSRTGARGLSLDLAIIDEALAHDTSLLAAIRPTMAQRDGAVGCIGTQLVLVSNAGDERSELLNEQRELGRRAVLGGDRSRVWFEWSAPDDCDPYDEAVWRSTIPTLGRVDGIDVEFVRSEAESMRVEDFRREYLCVHTARPVAAVIDPVLWAAAPSLRLPSDVAVSLGVEATVDHGAVSVVAAGAVGDEVVAIEVVAAEPGIDWVVGFLADVTRRHRATVVVDAYGPMASLIPMLERARVALRQAKVRDVVDAAAGFVDLVAAGRLAHARDARLDDAVVGVGRRKVGQRWTFSADGDRDITALQAAALAVWGVVASPPRRSAYDDDHELTVV